MRPEMYMALALLFLARGVPSNAESAEEEPPVQYFDVGRSFSLNCSQLADKGPFEWSKNGTSLAALGELSARVALDEGGAVLRLLGRSHEDDFGNYSCAAAGRAQAWRLHARPIARLAPDTNVVEGQKLKIVCKVVGKPYPSVSWTWSNSSSEAAGAPVLEALGARVQLAASEQGVAGAELVLEEARRQDAGVLRCAPRGGAAAATTLRVKDMYAALWPFLGICAEVFVLCAIILVYEKRRTKPELDDSDTDNHEQKKS